MNNYYQVEIYYNGGSQVAYVLNDDMDKLMERYEVYE